MEKSVLKMQATAAVPDCAWVTGLALLSQALFWPATEREKAALASETLGLSGQSENSALPRSL